MRPLIGAQLVAGFFVLVCLFLQQQTGQSAPDLPDLSVQGYWRNRRNSFYANTTFKLSEANMRLLGGGSARYSLREKVHLPFWFDYELYKAVFKKNYTNPEEELRRHLVYIKSCVRILKARVMYRILAATRDSKITKDADLFFEERVRGRQTTGSVSSQQEGGTNEIAFKVSFGMDSLSDNEKPLETALRLMREELGRVESRNQLRTYLNQLDEAEGLAIDGKLPYKYYDKYI